MHDPGGHDDVRGGRPDVGSSLVRLLASATGMPASELHRVVDAAGEELGGSKARMHIADYGLTSLQELGLDGPTGPRQSIEGTLAGRAFATSTIVVSPAGEGTVWIPLCEGSERLGVLELTHDDWSDDLVPLVAPIVRVLVLLLISLRRYTDVILRGRRAEPLTLAAEMQWDLLPPLTCATRSVSVSGILEPAYSIGGDSFDYAFNEGRADFAIVDAVGHGMSAVSISVLAINSLRNARREGHDLSRAYLDTSAALEAQFGDSIYVTGQIASLELDTGELTWLNAGHPLPLLVRGGSLVGPLQCRPSIPMGLGGTVKEVAHIVLQPGDRVLFYTDGAVESRSPEGEEFGADRLADHLLRAAADDVSPAETVRRLTSSLLAYNAATLRDDATLLLVDFHGSD